MLLAQARMGIGRTDAIANAEWFAINLAEPRALPGGARSWFLLPHELA
jgi:hypothetical protein